MKPWLKMLIATLAAILLVSAACLTSYYVGTRNGRRIAVDINDSEIFSEINEYEPRYGFLPKCYDLYICQMCSELNIDTDLAVAILTTENTAYDPDVIGKPNQNGTVDLGLWQLNDKYLWTTFEERYWFENVELNPFNWKHNTYIALHHLKYLTDKLKIEEDIIMAYNGGEGAVMDGTVKQSTYDYLTKVKNYLYLLRGEK